MWRQCNGVKCKQGCGADYPHRERLLIRSIEIGHGITSPCIELFPVANPSTQTSWWRHQMETFSTLLAICAGNSPVTDEFPTQRPVTRSFDVFFDLRLNKQLSKQWWGWWFETPSHPLWRHCNDVWCIVTYHMIPPIFQCHYFFLNQLKTLRGRKIMAAVL